MRSILKCFEDFQTAKWHLMHNALCSNSVHSMTKQAGQKEGFFHLSSTTVLPALEMRHITKTYPGVRALEDVSLEVRSGEVHALLGENGAGKSTLMKILAGAQTKDSGEILLNGQTVQIDGPQKAMDLGISI